MLPIYLLRLTKVNNMTNIPSVFWIVPVASIVALSMAYYFFRQMIKADEGTPRMIEIAEYVRKGAMAYLKQQYKVVAVVFVVLALLFAFMAYVLNVQNHWVWFALRTCRLFRNEECHLRFRPYCQCCS